jgi:hypothetical protein
MRKLIIVPIFHTDTDMGTFKERMTRIGEEQFGKIEWQHHKESIEKFWEELDRAIEKIIKNIDIGKLKIYQDGQVVDGPVGVKIIEETAEKGSKNHRIILKYIKKGATLMRTESFEALKEEYFLVRDMMTAKTPMEAERAAKAYEERKGELLKRRDKFIAKNIDKTLKEDEIGVLFIGATHNVGDELPPTINVEYLKTSMYEILRPKF